jgi:N-acetylglucosamine kinase-like BadF-type ATPase
MTQYFLGADLGATKTHVMIANELGNVKGFGEGGPGNHEVVGYEGFKVNLHEAVKIALKTSGINADQISGSGFGIAGYDWPSERPPTLAVLDTLKLGGKLELVNDTELGLLAGSPRGWGVTVVSGTGCNCCGWDASRTHFGRVTGGGISCGEYAGASEMMFMTSRALAYEWTGRGPATVLSKVFIEKYGVKNLEELLQNFLTGELELNPADARIVFQVAAEGDAVALDIIRWAGRELGELAKTVIRQLNFEQVDFDLVLIGSIFDGSPLLTEMMKATVYPFAPEANFIRAEEPPVVGAALLGMNASGIETNADIRTTLAKTLALFRKNGR